MNEQPMNVTHLNNHELYQYDVLVHMLNYRFDSASHVSLCRAMPVAKQFIGT